MHIQDFETFTPPPGSFRLVFAATAWHWINPALRYRRAHELMKTGGRLAFWNALHALPAASIRSSPRSERAYTAEEYIALHLDRLGQQPSRRRQRRECASCSRCASLGLAWSCGTADSARRASTRGTCECQGWQLVDARTGPMRVRLAMVVRTRGGHQLCSSSRGSKHTP